MQSDGTTGGGDVNNTLTFLSTYDVQALDGISPWGLFEEGKNLSNFLT